MSGVNYATNKKQSKPLAGGSNPPTATYKSLLNTVLNTLCKPHQDNLSLFLQYRQVNEASQGTLQFYQNKLGRFITEVNPDRANEYSIEKFLLQFDNAGNRHAYFRAIRTFYKWREHRFNLPNPMKHMKAPKLGKLIMPSLTQTQVYKLPIEKANSVRDKAIIALFTESGLRLSELLGIKLEYINWQSCTIRIIGKGNKEGYAPFGALSEQYLGEWLAQYQPNGNIWELKQWGIISMPKRLEETTGLPCNPHTFRRTFACLLRKAGIDTMTIKDLGR